MKKKIVFLFVVIISVFMFVISASAKEVVDSGNCGAQGDNVTWVLYDNGELVISGAGEMKDYQYGSSSPFNKNNAIVKVTIGDGITKIGKYTFYECGSLSITNISNDISIIGERAFYNCDSITKIDLPKDLVEIGEYAFAFCGNLSNVFIPMNVTKIADDSFYYCFKLEYIEVDTQNSNFFNDSYGALYSRNPNKLIQYPVANKSKTYQVLPDTTQIGASAFIATNITEITIPVSISAIYAETFYFSYNIDFVIYEGTQAQWNDVVIATSGNSNILDAKVHVTDHSVKNETNPANCLSAGSITTYCNVCEKTVKTVELEGSLGEHEVDSYKCIHCGKFIVEENETINYYLTTTLVYSNINWEVSSNIEEITSGYAYTNSGWSHYITIKALRAGDGYIKASYNGNILNEATIIVKSHEHDYSSTVLKKGNCINKAVLKYICDCGYSYEAETEIDITNHVETKTLKKVLIEPTCNEVGSGEYTCACGYIFTKSIPAINHSNATTDNGTPATCTQTGFTAGKYCPDCKTWLEGHEVIPTTAHSYTSLVTTEATCFKEGVITYTCTCGDSYTETLPKKEHEYGKWEVKTKATCTKAGLEWSYCLNCDNDFEREIPATGHNVIEYVMRASTDEMAAYGGDGAYITSCDVCNEIFKQEFFARPDEYKLSTSSYTYNGNVRKPTVTVKDADGKTLVAGKDYDVIYPDGMKLPGKYEITVLFKGNYLGEKKLSFTIKPKATTGLKAKTQDTKTITLSWSKTTGATGYEVYKYNSSSKKYEKIASTTSRSYKVTKLTAGTAYKFKVRAYTKAGTNIFGAYSSVFSTATKTAKPTLKTATLSSGKVTLTWNNVSGESGYEIYYSTSKNGTYKKMASVAANKTSYTTSKLTAGKSYYFKVKAYKTVGDSKVYSAFSDVKSVNIPVVYYITKTGKKYHVDGCRSLSQSKIQISYSNAVARGYKPCNSCIG